MIARTFLNHCKKPKLIHQQSVTLSKLKFGFSQNNQPQKSPSGKDQQIEKSTGEFGGVVDEPYMAEPKRVGMSYEDYAKQKKSLDEKKKAIEVETIKS